MIAPLGDSAERSRTTSWPAWASALLAALDAFAKDQSLPTVYAPLCRAVEELTPGWRCAIELLHADEEAGAEAAAARRVLALGRLQFVRAPIESDTPRLVAPLVASDAHMVGFLALDAEAATATPPELEAPLLGLLRLIALFAEDRSALKTGLARDALLAALVDTVPDALVTIDEAGRILTFNKAAEDLFGWPEAEIAGQPVHRLMPEPHAARHDGYIARYLRTGERRLENWRRRFEAKRRDGSVFPVEIALGEARAGERRRFIGVMRDVSARLEEESRLNALRREAEDAARLSAIGEMAASIAHEVNQPLTALGNYLDAAISRIRAGAAPDETLDLLERARRMAEAGGDVVSRVRRLTQRGSTELSPLNLDEAVAETLTHFDPAVRQAQARLRHEKGAPTPILADRVQIQQVVANLVRNALEAVAGSDRRDVLVRTAMDGESVVLSVEDTGPGVPEADRASLFHSFTTRRRGGVGLGLAISRRIAEAHGGSIEYAERPGGGARFTVRLPLQEEYHAGHA